MLSFKLEISKPPSFSWEGSNSADLFLDWRGYEIDKILIFHNLKKEVNDEILILQFG